jgi:Family of unknown function (DUF5367)
MHRRLLLYGFALWLAASIIFRIAGQRIFHPGNTAGTLITFAISFPLMAWVARRLCLKSGVPREAWPAGAISLALPTLLLDPFSSAFFPVVFPNIPASAAGLFGGLMLWCCAGALAGALFLRPGPAH